MFLNKILLVQTRVIFKKHFLKFSVDFNELKVKQIVVTNLVSVCPQKSKMGVGTLDIASKDLHIGEVKGVLYS